jgi:hypothetical protein
MTMDWEKWEKEQRPELEQKLAELKQSRDLMDKPELEPLRDALDNFIADVQRVIDAGEMERKAEQGGAVPGPEEPQ